MDTMKDRQAWSPCSSRGPALVASRRADGTTVAYDAASGCRPRGPNRLLAIGCHADDIEIGCGGTMLTLLLASEIEVTWVVLGARGDREAEARASAEASWHVRAAPR